MKPTNVQQGHYRAHTNIALIKYWGKRDARLFLPLTSSLSLTLDAFYTDTKVSFDPELSQDQFILDGQLQSDSAHETVSRFVDLFRQEAGVQTRVLIESTNHVPTAAGLASSASAYAALSCACNQALGLNLSNQTLSTFARQGSGSASRSLFGGFVLWHKGHDFDSASSYAEMINPADWDIAMLAVVVNAGSKKIPSRQGMQHTIATSPYHALWPQEVERDLAAIIPAIQAHDLDTVGQIAEHNAMKMHASMLAANPSFTYFEPGSLLAMDLVRQLRQQGLSAYFTMDAGPNVKVICRQSQLDSILKVFKQHFAESALIVAKPGPAPYAID
ncbi:diphosphomevalonate decarboxylase [Vaginisenegalia massiliensis]|uniref:diphosphomevalonate decarboxylase n=1 Tax=Vaginisenegalia massiliensis TaxID=2058294 RepID=UPI000F546864|nr:diphosphomevalonate decarboxylase [Vaginisenegalia massiliensis]